MLILRFNRTGKKNRVSYRIVLQEHTQAPGKRHIEILGSHDPHSKNTVLKEDRIKHWLGEGVQMSDAVHNLLVSKGLVEAKKRAIKMERPVKDEEGEAPAESTESESVSPEVAEAPQEETATPEAEEVKEVSKEAESSPEEAPKE